MLLRSFTSGLEVRDGRTITGRAVPWYEPAEIHSHGETYVEEFSPGSVSPMACQLTADHPQSGRDLPVGHGPLRNEPDGLYGDWRVSRTTFGDDLLELVRDGAVDGLSVGFQPVLAADLWTADRSHVTRTQVVLDHVAVVRRGAYTGAKILALRGARCGCAACEARSAPLTIAQARAELNRRRWPPGMTWEQAMTELRARYVGP